MYVFCSSPTCSWHSSRLGRCSWHSSVQLALRIQAGDEKQQLVPWAGRGRAAAARRRRIMWEEGSSKNSEELSVSVVDVDELLQEDGDPNAGMELRF